MTDEANEKSDAETGDSARAAPADSLAEARARLLDGVGPLSPTESEALDGQLSPALRTAAAADAEVLTVMNPVMRPVTLRLASLATDTALDAMYAQEWAELSVSANGALYLVYRRRDGEDYAVEWSPATSLPASLLRQLEPTLLGVMMAPRDHSDERRDRRDAAGGGRADG